MSSTELKSHEQTFLKLRISELEDKCFLYCNRIADLETELSVSKDFLTIQKLNQELYEVTECLVQEQLWREESLQEVIQLKKHLQELISGINEYASRPTKDGASKLLDIVYKIEHGE